MNVMHYEQVDPSYAGGPPVLLVATSDVAANRAMRPLQASGLRIGARVPVEDAIVHMERQIAASALWFEADRDAGGAMDALLDRIRTDVADGRYAAVVSGTSDLVDPVVASLGDSPVQTIFEADDAQRVASLAIAISSAGMEQRLSDVASDQNAARLRQLSDEVNRIAATLARLSSGPPQASVARDPVHVGDLPEVSADSVRSVIRARRLRSRYFPEELFADPAWDMLLDLLQAEIAHLRVPVSSLCIAAAVPATTALRWLKTMVSEGIFVRRADPHDGRRVFVELAPDTSRALRRYFAEVGNVAVI